jgi:hypothetical protein
MKLSSSIRILCAFTLLSLASCKKDNSLTTEIPQELAEATANEADFTETFDDVFDNTAGIDGASAGDDLGMYGATGFGLFPSQATNTTSRCFTVTVTPKDKGVFPKTVVLDFGSGCDMNGHIRKGKIITVYSGPLHKPGSRAVTEFDGYQIDNRKIMGRHIVENTTIAGSNQRQFTRSFETKIINVNDQSWKAWTGTTTMTQLEGNGTPLWPVDDVFQFTGKRRGETSKGRSWMVETVNPLIKAFTCRWITKGSVHIRVNDTVGTLNYGNGDCDNEAILTVKGASRTIKLR